MSNQLFSISNFTNPSGLLSKAAKYLPTPQNGFSAVAETLGNVGRDVIGGVTTAVDGDFQELLQLQLETQVQMQSISMSSNIEKSKHESKMAAIRNVRVS